MQQSYSIGYIIQTIQLCVNLDHVPELGTERTISWGWLKLLQTNLMHDNMTIHMMLHVMYYVCYLQFVYNSTASEVYSWQYSIGIVGFNVPIDTL